MNLKQFLKSDWRKTVIFAILYIIFLFYMIITNFGFLPYVKCPSKYVEMPDIFTNSIGCFREDLLFVYYTFLLFLVPTIWFYILSCLIIWVYDKFRKKK
jgi:hypothetical protein